MDVKMVQIAVGILGQDQGKGLGPGREWAVDVISHYAGPVKPSEAARKLLLNTQGGAIGVDQRHWLDVFWPRSL